jgi:transposase
VEKLFDTLKNSTPNKRLYAASDTKAHGKMFLGFIAVILYISMENLLRKHELLNRVTVNQAFDLLRKVRIGISSNGQRSLQEIPKKTRILLESLDIITPADNHIAYLMFSA